MGTEWKKDDPVVVFNLWRGHAFLYTPEAHNAAKPEAHVTTVEHTQHMLHV